MRSICAYSKTFVTLLLWGILTSPLLLSSCNAKPAPKSRVKKATVKSGSAVKSGSKAQGTLLRLKRHAFPDVTMGISAAYTVMLPVNWSAQGHIEWQAGVGLPFPQKKIEIKSPGNGRLSYDPVVTFTYMESSRGTEGVPAPANFPQWLVQAAAQTDRTMSDIKLVKSSRDAKIEAMAQKMDASVGGGGGMEREMYNIVLEYTQAKVRRREELSIMYVKFAPFFSQNLNSQVWSIYPNVSISAPVAQFAAQEALLMNVGRTLRSTPHWYAQSQAAIAAMSRQRVADNWALIRGRGSNSNQVSDDQYAKYKQDMAKGDDAQHQRINSIYETDDFKDSNGDIVNLPMHYKNVFSDGKGNYVLSNNSLDKPGASWQSIHPMK